MSIAIEAPGADQAGLAAALKALVGIQDNFDTVAVSTTTAGVRAGVCKVAGFIATAAGTVTLYANSSNTGTIIGGAAYTVTAGQIVTFPAPYVSALGLSVQIAGGAAITLSVA